MKQDGICTHSQSSVVLTESASPFSQVLARPDAVRLARQLQALADPTRLQILLLLKTYRGLLSVDEIVALFPLTQPTISHHLHILLAARLIACKKQGLWAYYFVQAETGMPFTTMQQAIDLLTRVFLTTTSDEEGDTRWT